MIEAVIDTHVHVACDAARYPSRPTGVGSLWWSGPDGTADAVLGAARDAGVAHVVVVQAVGAYGHDCSCARDVVAASDGFASLVASIDMADPKLETQLDRIPEGVAGLRLFGVADGSPWLDDGRADVVWEWATRAGVVLVPTIFTGRLGAMRTVIERHPNTTVALDHCAFPDMADRPEEAELLALADLGPLHLKVSSHVLLAWQAERRLEAAFARLAEAFGPDRICWGSDHPQEQGSTYGEKLALARRAASVLDTAGQAAFFSGTATHLGWAG